MAKIENRVYSRYSTEALNLLAKHIKATRIKDKISAQELSDRAGISRGLLRRIESADPSCSIGSYFEVATILGLQLFSSDYDELNLRNKIIDEKLALLPKRAKQAETKLDDNF